MDNAKKKKKGIYLFRPFGFEVSLDLSWFLLAALIAWTLAVGYFPFTFKGLSPITYWLMGIGGAIGLFFSIIFHELCHSLVGRRFGLPITGIQLFIFGGVAQTSQEPPNAKTEFLTAIAGPISSLILGYIFYLLYHLGLKINFPMPVNGVLNYLSFINILLAIFNLLPGFPLDGGRVFRSILWGWKKDFKWATRIATLWGQGMGYLLIIFGIFLFFRGAFISGIWMFLIGFFLKNSAQSAYQYFLIQELFHNDKIRNYTKTNPITVAPNVSLQSLVDDYFHKHYYKMYPVVENENLIGYVSLAEIRGHEREEWQRVVVREIMHECSPDILIDANSSVIQALQQMTNEKQVRLLVTEAGKLYGVISMRDLTHIIAMKMEIRE